MRKHQGTRMFAGVLSCALALSLLPGTALAAEEAATVYQGDGYYITVELYGNQNLDLDSTSLFSDGLVNFGRDEGFADKDGNVVLSYDNLEGAGYILTGDFHDGLCAVRVPAAGYSADNGYIDKSGRLAIPPQFSEARSFSNGLALVRFGEGRYEGQWGYIDTSGDVIYVAPLDHNENSGLSDGYCDAYSAFGEGTAIVYLDSYGMNVEEYENTYCLIDENGNEVDEYVTDDYLLFNGGFSEGYVITTGDYDPYTNSVTIRDREMNEVWRGSDYYLSSSVGVGAAYSFLPWNVYNGLLPLYQGNNRGAVLNVKTGEFLVEPTYNLFFMDNFSDGLVTAFQGAVVDGCCVMDTTGRYVIPTGDFEWIGPFNEGVAVAEKDDQYYLLEKHDGTWSGQGQPEEEGYEYGQVPDCPKLQATGTCTGSFTMNDSEGQLRTVYVFPAGTTFSTVEPQWDFITQVKELATGEILYDAAEMSPGVAYEIKVTDTWGPVVYAYVQVGGSAQPEQPATVAGFTDVAADAWYASFVETVAEKGLFSGKGNGIFAPNDSMTYAEFLVVLSQFSGETVTPVEGGAWYEGYVNWAQPLIPAGMAEGFNPNAPITRQDMAALFGTFLNAYDYSAEPVNQDDPAFTDAASIADYADSGVELCYQLGIMSGKDNNRFDPAGTTTRAEVAVTMTQMARVMGR